MPINVNKIDTLLALNDIASYIGLPPLIQLTDLTTEPDFIMAQQILDESTRSILAQGLPCNTDYNFPLTEVDVDSKVIVPAGALTCDIQQNGFVERDGLVYDTRLRESTEKLTLKAEVVWNLEFDLLPELVKKYITTVAARSFVARVKGDSALAQLTIPDEVRTKREFQRYVLAMGDISLLDGEVPYMIGRQGRNFYNFYNSN